MTLWNCRNLFSRCLLCCLAGLCLAGSGCASRRTYAYSYPGAPRRGWNSTQVGAGLGAVGGTVLGGVIGHQFGHTGTGALVGGLAGTATGALAGNMKDVNDERDRYARQAAYYESELERRNSAMLTNRDVIAMANAGCSDRIILNAIQSRGGRFDVSPQQLIVLSEYGVSDLVVSTMQMYPAY